IQRDAADVMIAGGSEAIIVPLTIAGFCSMKAMSTRNDEPAKAMRPFDASRDGFVAGEGAGILILESLDHALARDARIYAEIVGYGMTGDAHHMTAPDPEGDGAARAMAAAVHDAGLDVSAVGYINAHGTSTPYNDKFETTAIKRVFGDHARRLAVSSTKSMTGHLLGAAGGIEAIATVLALHHGVLPLTTTYDPAASVGALTSQRAELVTGVRLARWAVELDLGPLLRLGRGEDQSGGRARESILASALETVLGAIYAEGGLEALRSAVGRLAAW